MKNSLKALFILTLLFGAGIASNHFVGSALKASRAPAQTLPVGRAVPDFRLTESHEQPVTLADLKGKVWVANLMFASCPDVCVRMAEQFAKLDRQLGPRDDVRLVSVTITPEADTPAVLRAYAEKLGASEKWWFLTGDRSEVVKLANQGFLLSAGTAETLTHSDKLVLVDRTGTVRGYFDGGKPESVPQLAAEIARLTATQSR
jgi:protein SCO1/2